MIKKNLLDYLPQDLREKYLKQVPIPVIAIAKELGLDIFETLDFKTYQAGSIKKDDDRYTIYLNALDAPGRKRFTIAHEIGHFLLHQKDLSSGKELITDVKQPINKFDRKTNEKIDPQTWRKETEANQFAAELLMPEELFKKAWEASESVDQMADIFEVSPGAVVIRAKELLGRVMI